MDANRKVEQVTLSHELPVAFESDSPTSFHNRPKDVSITPSRNSGCFIFVEILTNFQLMWILMSGDQRMNVLQEAIDNQFLSQF
jgi:hypothetical protein